MQRWRLVVAYRGTELVGWQRQRRGRSVQGLLEEALARVVGHPVEVSGSGRTDAGVHALGQVCAFDSPTPRTPRELVLGANAYLPEDVACLEATPAPPDFDPRRWARAKRYRYAFLDRLGRSPLLADRTWHCRSTLDVEAMDAAARLLVGTHDVASFRSVGCSASTTTRTLADARVQRVDELVHLEIEGHGFLRHMVRILAGTLREVGLGSRSVDDFATTLAARDRRTAGRTAPPHGLTLLWVRHADGPVAWREDEGEDG